MSEFLIVYFFKIVLKVFKCLEFIWYSIYVLYDSNNSLNNFVWLRMILEIW